MLTTEQAKQYLDSVGVSLPDFMLAALVDQANTIESCLTEHYTPGIATLIQCYLIGLMGLAQGDRYISSQSAPSGASQSFRYQSFADRWAGLLSLMRGLDKHGCATGLIPPDPTKKSYAGMWVATGGCGGGA